MSSGFSIASVILDATIIVNIKMEMYLFYSNFRFWLNHYDDII